jgi:transposase InsO family protein
VKTGDGAVGGWLAQRSLGDQLANAVFAYLEGFYNPRRRHFALGYLSPVDHETA